MRSIKIYAGCVSTRALPQSVVRKGRERERRTAGFCKGSTSVHLPYWVAVAPLWEVFAVQIAASVAVMLFEWTLVLA
jgi:hypothetical protein